MKMVAVWKWCIFSEFEMVVVAVCITKQLAVCCSEHVANIAFRFWKPCLPQPSSSRVLENFKLSEKFL